MIFQDDKWKNTNVLSSISPDITSQNKKLFSPLIHMIFQEDKWKNTKILSPISFDTTPHTKKYKVILSPDTTSHMKNTKLFSPMTFQKHKWKITKLFSPLTFQWMWCVCKDGFWTLIYEESNVERDGSSRWFSNKKNKRNTNLFSPVTQPHLPCTHI
jgi:hypothetical protein